MADNLESERRELQQAYDELEQAERAQDHERTQQLRALTRQLADKITDMEQGDNA